MVRSFGHYQTICLQVLLIASLSERVQPILPFSLVNPVTGAGPNSAQVEAFTTGTGGTFDGTLDQLSTTEHWEMVTAGNFTGSSLSLTANQLFHH